MQNKRNFFFYPLLILSFCFSLCKFSFSQSDSSQYIISKHFLSVEDGLASREVFCGIQDNDGFMWFGTRNGLNRYDGKNFKLFTKQKNGLADNKIIQLAKDNNDHLLLMYGNPGFARSAMRTEAFDLKTNKVKSLKEIFPGLPFKEEYLYWVTNDGSDICFLTSNPFQYWRFSNGKFVLKCEMKLWDNIVGKPEDVLTANGAYHTTTGYHSIFSGNYAALFLGNPMPYYFVTPDTVLMQNPDYEKGVMVLTPQHKVLFNSPGNIISLLNQDGSIERNTQSFKPPLSVEIEEQFFRRSNCKEMLTYSDADGLFLYDFEKWYQLLEKKELKISSGNGLYGFYKDRQDNFWIFTSGGIAKIKVEKNPFTHYFTRAQLKANTDNQARGIFADEGTVYAGIWDNFYLNNGKQNTYCRTSTSILYGVCRHSNKIYAGSYYLNVYDENKNTFSHHAINFDAGDIWTIDSLSPDRLLLGASVTVFTFNTISNEMKEPVYSSAVFPKVKFVYRFIKRKDKKNWAVAQNGLYLLNDPADTVLDYWGKEKNTPASHQFPFDLILDGYEDNDGMFWFATSGEGLYRWDRNKNTFQQFNITAGMPSDILYRIESDNYNNLWISTDNGLVRFNTKDFKTNTYTTANGISHNEFNRISSFKASDGRLFFGGLNGVNAFYPKDFMSDSTAETAPLRIISFNKFSGDENKLTDKTDELLTKDKIVLQPGDRFFNLEFKLLDFGEGKLNYAYKIDGIDRDWNYINENSIRISGLPYGEFTLNVKGQSHSGQWSKSELKIPLIVIKPFYLQWWFIALSCVLLVLAFILIYRWRVRQLLKSKLTLEKEVLSRTKDLKESLAHEQSLLKEKDVLLKEIHHRVKNNLQVISGLLELQEKNLTDEQAKQALLEGRNRVRSMALIHQNLYEYENLSRIELSSFVGDLYKQVSAMFENKSKDTTVKINIPVTEIDIDTAVPFGLALNELLTNSYKYAFVNGSACAIEMVLITESNDGEDGRKFIFTYSDTGPGLPAGFDIKKSKSLGMRLINDLSKQMGGSMNYAFDNGSRFTIHFSDKKARKKND